MNQLRREMAQMRQDFEQRLKQMEVRLKRLEVAGAEGAARPADAPGGRQFGSRQFGSYSLVNTCREPGHRRTSMGECQPPDTPKSTIFSPTGRIGNGKRSSVQPSWRVWFGFRAIQMR